MAFELIVIFSTNESRLGGVLVDVLPSTSVTEFRLLYRVLKQGSKG
jgi:hypothetical protein